MTTEAFFATVGWIGNACFFSRFFLQWLASERAKKSVAPVSFWWISLCGSVALMTYTLHLGEYVLFAGGAINALIYTRNLALRDRDTHPLSQAWVGLVAIVAIVLLVLGVLAKEPVDSQETSTFWFALVVIGQSFWSARFVIQWMASERAGTSHFPAAFWWVSLAGSTLLLSYAVSLANPILIAGYAASPLVPVRNLMLRRGASRRDGSRELSGTGSAG